MTKFFRSVAVALALFGVSAGSIEFAHASPAAPVTAKAALKARGKFGKANGAFKGLFKKAPRVQVEARFVSFVRGKNGKIRGIKLSDGSVVRVKQRALKNQNLKPGDVLKIDAKVATKGGKKVYARAKISFGGATIFEAPKGRFAHMKKNFKPMSAQGAVVKVLVKKNGKVRGVVLADGTKVIGRKGSLAGVKVGDTIKVDGKGGAMKKGRVLFAMTITKA